MINPRNCPVPARLAPYFNDVDVHPAEVIHTHELNKLRATRELAEYKSTDKHPVSVLEVTEAEVTDWMIHVLALERANNAYRREANKEEERIKREAWKKEQTCPYCKQVDATVAIQPDGHGKMCQDCRDVLETMRIDQLKTKERVKALGEAMGGLL